MSTSPPKNSSEGALEGSQPPPPKVLKGRTLKLLSKLFDPIFGGSKEKPGEPQSSEVNENPEGPKTDKVSSEGTGGKKVFKPKELKICWQEENQFWSIPEGDDDPAELLEVCWLDVSGEMPVTKGKAYEVSFMLSMNTQNSFGWDDPVTVMARRGEEGEYTRVQIDLSKLKGEVVEFPSDKCRVEPKSEEKSESKEEPGEKESQTKSKSEEKSESKEEPGEKKSQIKPKSDENAKNDKETLYFGLYEVWTNKWKGGLRIHKAIVQEIPAGNNASTSNTPSDESRGKEIAA